ncbi:putative serine C-palmitoyltransferase [Helianthus annuus]|nr:putative serine C-palmitoyltransferase [Helianthus annuus]
MSIALSYSDKSKLIHHLQRSDCFGRPISSPPDAWFDVLERVSNDNNKTLKRTTKVSRCLNLGSYNYLGFAAADEYCTPRVIQCLKKYFASTCSSRADGGTTTLHSELEEAVANFIGKPAALVTGMGYVTNSAILPVLIGKGGLIISDSLNHNSIVNGARGSGATIRVFQHNTPSHLEDVLREHIAHGQPRTHRPWKKIMVVVEGIYSMEGEICKLPEIVSICKKYKVMIFFLFFLSGMKSVLWCGLSSLYIMAVRTNVLKTGPVGNRASDRSG